MQRRSWLFWIICAIAVITVFSGFGQMVMPSLVLSIVGGESTATSNHFFSIVGMFMVLFGGLLLQAMLHKEKQPIAVFWSGLQKVGACIAVTIGVFNGIFGGIALLVAGFDGLSAVLIMLYWLTIK